MTTLPACCVGIETPDAKRRQMLLLASSAVGAVAGAGLAIPLLSSMMPSESAKAAGAPVEANISRLQPGQIMTVEWRGKPVWIVHRTREMIASLKDNDLLLVDPASARPQQPDYASNAHRSIKPEIMVAVGICTHLGCSPTQKFRTGSVQGMAADWPGGFLCPCHGSMFDLAGRVFKNMPAPTNLEVPAHKYLSESRMLIGDDASV